MKNRTGEQKNITREIPMVYNRLMKNNEKKYTTIQMNKGSDGAGGLDKDGGRAAAQFAKMTETPIPRLIFGLGIPTIISMLVTSLYNMADTYFVGRLGTSASGATGIVFGLMAVLQAFGFMFGHGAGSIIARRLGARDIEGASRFSSTGFALSVGTAVIIAACGLLFMDPLMRAMGSTETILPYARVYAFYILLAAPFMMSSFVMNNVLRYEGKAALSMIGLCTGALLNIAGDPFLMFTCHMGIAGAGLSTALSQLVSFGILISMFVTRRTQTRLSPRYITRSGADVWEIVTTGFPSLSRQGLSSISTMILNLQAGVYGDAAVSAMSIVGRVSFFIFAVGLGIGQGYQPVAGFNYGARKYSRLRQGFIFTFGFSEVFMGLLAVIVGVMASATVGRFISDPAVIAIGTAALQYQCAAMFFQPAAVTTNMLFQSIGISGKATFLSILRSGLFFIPLVVILPGIWGIFGVQVAQPLADVMTFVVSVPFAVAFFRKLPADEA